MEGNEVRRQLIPTCSFVQNYFLCLFCAYSVLGAEDQLVRKTDKIPVLWGLCSTAGESK